MGPNSKHPWMEPGAWKFMDGTTSIPTNDTTPVTIEK